MQATEINPRTRTNLLRWRILHVLPREEMVATILGDGATDPGDRALATHVQSELDSFPGGDLWNWIEEQNYQFDVSICLDIWERSIYLGETPFDERSLGDVALEISGEVPVDIREVFDAESYDEILEWMRDSGDYDPLQRCRDAGLFESATAVIRYPDIQEAREVLRIWG